MRSGLRTWQMLALTAAVAIFASTAVAEAMGAAQWTAYGRDDTQQRFSPLASINKDSIEKLGLKWFLDLPEETALVSTPLMVGDTLYFTGKFSVVYAVSARTGTLQWVFDPKSREVLAKTPRRMSVNWGTSRGLAYWEGKIMVATADGRLIAVAARSGKPIWTTQTLDPSSPLSISGAPLAYNGKVLIGNAGGDWGHLRGYVTAYDAKDGRQLWRFYTVPGDPAVGFENGAMQMAAHTWSGRWWESAGGGAVWNSMTYDSEFNRVYIGTGNGSPWNQQLRGRAGGDNLFVASIVALDADSGHYAWHYQVVPGDAWDFDATADLVLAHLNIDGAPRKVLLQASKNGFFYVLDRRTGQLLSAEKFVHVTWAERVDLVSGRPIEAPGMRPTDGPVLVWPGAIGGHNWPPMSFSPETNLVYIPTLEMPEIFDARGVDPSSWTQQDFTLWSGYSDIIGRNAVPAAPAPSSVDAPQPGAWLQARDPRTNRMVWKARQPGFWAGGTLATGGHLVFIGQANGHLAAYDADNGQLLWSYDCGRPITAPPISYAIGGTQYIGLLVGWGGLAGAEGSLSDPSVRMGYRDGARRLLAFALNATGTLPSSPPSPGLPIDIPGFVPDRSKVERGQRIFDTVCSNCHGSDARSGGGAPDLRASPMASDLAVLQQVVLHGALQLRGMPQYSDFTAQDVEDIYHYIRFRSRVDLHSPP